MLSFVMLASGVPTEFLEASEYGESKRKYSFSLSAQPLDSALVVFGDITGIQVLYETSLTSGLQSSAVEGLFTPMRALGLLLQGTGLEPRITVEDGFTLAPVDPSRQASHPSWDTGQALGLPADWMRFVPFFGGAQADILAILCRTTATSPGKSSLTLRLWIDSLGSVTGVDVIHPSGERSRDRAIVELLRRLRLGEPPPPDMPQPVTLSIGGGEAVPCPGQ